MKIQQYLVADWFIRFTSGYEDREDDLGVKCRLLEIRNSCKIFWTGGRIMALNQMKVELHINHEIIHQILYENSRRGTSAQSLLHTASEMSNRNADAQPVNTSSRPVYTFSIAALLEMSTGCFSTILK